MKIVRYALLGLSFLILIAIVVITTIYVWPLHRESLRHSNGQHVSYATAIQSFADIETKETSDSTIKPECHSQLFVHGNATAKAVVMFHGYTACPNQFKALAMSFYTKGYNVYVPRAPYHGLVDERAHAHVTADGLITYTDQAITLGSGLGNEVGVVGISGGGVLASWSALYRSEVVRRALILAPFYEPHTSQIAKWKLKPFEVLYGFGFLPDTFTDTGFSYHALSQYLIITQNLDGIPRPKLSATALVVAEGDTSIDHEQAKHFITFLSSHPTTYTPPASWGLTHDIVDGKEVSSHATELYATYLRLYEGL